MKILVVGSNGRVGSLVVKEAINKGLDVVGLAKSESKSLASKFILKDALNLTSDDVKDFDVVVDAVGGWDEKTIPNISNVMIHLANILTNLKTRLIVVGGAGSLYVDENKTITVDMQESFPDSWKPLSNAHGVGLKYLKETNNLNWTYISPACNFVSDGIKTNEYKLGHDNVILNSNGESSISYADYAIALVDEIINNKYNKQRICVVSK